jgi:hypothetical protein
MACHLSVTRISLGRLPPSSTYTVAASVLPAAEAVPYALRSSGPSELSSDRIWSLPLADAQSARLWVGLLDRGASVASLVLPVQWLPRDAVVAHWFPMKAKGQGWAAGAQALVRLHWDAQGTGAAFRAPLGRLAVTPAWGVQAPAQGAERAQGGSAAPARQAAPCAAQRGGRAPTPANCPAPPHAAAPPQAVQQPHGYAGHPPAQAAPAPQPQCYAAYPTPQAAPQPQGYAAYPTPQPAAARPPQAAPTQCYAVYPARQAAAPPPPQAPPTQCYAAYQTPQVAAARPPHGYAAPPQAAHHGYTAYPPPQRSPAPPPHAAPAQAAPQGYAAYPPPQAAPTYPDIPPLEEFSDSDVIPPVWPDGTPTCGASPVLRD